jgi:hypothetical protein
MIVYVIGLLLTLVVAGTVLAAPDLSSFNREGCPERTVLNWCASKLRAAGWSLRYESRSPQDLADASWHHEIWTRERDAVLCMFAGGRGGIRINTCNVLREVNR